METGERGGLQEYSGRCGPPFRHNFRGVCLRHRSKRIVSKREASRARAFAVTERPSRAASADPRETPAWRRSSLHQTTADNAEGANAATSSRVLAPNAFAGGAWSIEVLVDGVRRTTLRAKTYAFFPVEPGTREIKFHWMSAGLAANPDIVMVANLASDKTYYFTFSADAHVVVNGKSTFSSLVQQIDRHEAQDRKMTFEMRDVQ